MSKAQTEEELAVKRGYWHNFRFNPAAENKFTLDSKAPTEDYQAFLDGEVRYNALKRANPEKAARLFAKNEACLLYTSHHWDQHPLHRSTEQNCSAVNRLLSRFSEQAFMKLWQETVSYTHLRVRGSKFLWK